MPSERGVVRNPELLRAHPRLRRSGPAVASNASAAHAPTCNTLNAATEVQYEIDIQLPDTGAGADNDVQGKTATFAFTWTLS